MKSSTSIRPGIEALPADLVYIPKWMTPDVDYDTDCMEEDSDLRNVLDALEDFIESNLDDVTSIQLVEGYGARLSATGQLDGAVIEEIQVGGCYGTSTDVLNAEMRRAVENVSRKK